MVSRGAEARGASLDGGHRAVARVLDILETLSTRPAGASLTELSVTLEAPKTSLLPLLRTLVSRGYAARGDAGSPGARRCEPSRRRAAPRHAGIARRAPSAARPA